MKACPVREELKGYGVAAPGSGAAGKWDGARASVGHLGAATLGTFLTCHFLSIMIDVGNVEEKGGAAVVMATGVSECQNTEEFSTGALCEIHIGRHCFSVTVFSFTFSRMQNHLAELAFTL